MRASRSVSCPTDVRELECDILSATGRKFLRGPRGTGFLYVRQGLIEQLEPPFLDLHAAEWDDGDTFSIRADARRFENWETSYATKLGLAAAVDYALGWGLEAIAERVQGLAASLREQLAAIPGVEVHDRGVEKCGIVTFTVAGEPAAEVAKRLSAARRQRLGHPGHLQPARPGSAWARRGRAGVGALLQHRGGAGAAR